MAAALKDQFANSVIADLSDRFALSSAQVADNVFDTALFSSKCLEHFPDLELKDRISLVADTLREMLDDDYERALEVVVDVARGGIEGFAAWPLCTFVERHGTSHPEASLLAMSVLTRQFSCEFAIRPFLEHHLEMTRTHMRKWVHDKDESVRRLPSEGTRPILPWGPKVQALNDNPDIGLELLEGLRNDPSETVRRSVANHLNDISKTDGDLVISVLQRWTGPKDPVDPSLVSHALRSLVKKGHEGAMELLGFTTRPDVVVDSFECRPDRISLGAKIELAATVRSTGSGHQRMVVDFVIHHVNANGETSPKVFKWTAIDLEPGEVVVLTKQRTIATASTRRYHAGTHRIDLQISGVAGASTAFALTESS